jgi:hypothetical protein
MMHRGENKDRKPLTPRLLIGIAIFNLLFLFGEIALNAIGVALQ